MAPLLLLSLAGCGGSDPLDSTLEDPQRRRNRGNDLTPPTVNIVKQGAVDIQGATSLDGAASDDIQVARVTWSNDRGGSGSASLSGSTTQKTWVATGITLQSGDNLLTVVAVDAAGNRAQATQVLNHVLPPPPPPPPLLAQPPTRRPSACFRPAAGRLSGGQSSSARAQPAVLRPSIIRWATRR